MTIWRALMLGCLLSASPLMTRADVPKLSVSGDTLLYDTANASGDSTDIEVEDVEIVRALLAANPQVRVMQLNSGGGSVWAAQTISDIVIDYELDTRVDGDCDSSCVTIFLAGKARSMTRGSRLGFHQIHWSADNIAEYYESEAREFGWDSPWDFAQWLYEDTQQEVYLTLNYMVARGVDPGFAIQAIREPDGSVWRPHRAVLRAAGVLRD